MMSCSKFLNILSNKGTVSSSGSTVHVVWAAVPVGLWAASGWAFSLIRTTLLVGSHLHDLPLLGNKGTVSRGGSTVHVVWATEPVGLWATSSGALSLIRSTLLVGSHPHDLLLLGNKGTVSRGGSTVHVVRAAEPVGLWAATSGALSLIRSTLLVGSHPH